MKYANINLGTIEAIINKLGGEEGVKKFLSGELVVSTAKPVWKTVKLGTYKTPDEYREALKSAGMSIGVWGDDWIDGGNYVLNGIACSKEEIDLDLLVLSVGDIGFKGGANYSSVCAKARELGLNLCPAEVGPALRLQYGDQPNGEWLRIAMKAVSGVHDGSVGLWDENLYIFCVVHDDDGLLLRGKHGNPDSICQTNDRLVFVKPRNKK